MVQKHHSLVIVMSLTFRHIQIGIYEKFKFYSFRENVGIYYQDDVNGIDPDTEIPEANKMQKRVITYTKIN